MKRVFVNEKWCLGCHLCEYNCAFANSGGTDMTRALKGMKIQPNIRVEGDDKTVCFAVSCRHCSMPLCAKGCLTGACTVSEDGTVMIDADRCVHCYTCVASCPYGCVTPGAEGGVVQKCELCISNAVGEPACVKGCPNNAIVFEERE